MTFVRKLLAVCAAPLCMALLAPQAEAQQAPARTTSLPVGRCMNLGNSFESPGENSWGGARVTREQLQAIASAGFQTIRFPVRWDTHVSAAPDYRIDPAYLARVREVVDQAQAAGLNVILNSHHFERIHEDPAGSTAQLAAMWDQIGTAFASYPRDRLWFELENEPHNRFNHSNLLATLTPALAAVRRTNPDRPVIIGGENWSGIDSLATLPLPNDPHIIPTFHYYEPFDFTHQGASWVNPSPPTGRRYGGVADARRLADDVAKLRAYIARTGLTPFMGETGAHTTAPLDQRVAYHRAINDAFLPTGIGMCMWGFTNTFPFFDHRTGTWLPGLRAAIGLQEPAAQAAGRSAPPPDSTRQPTAALQALDDALPGVLINDPASLNWAPFGPTLRVAQRRSEDIPGGGAALRATIARAGATPYEAGFNAPIRTAVRRGQTYTAAFYARTISAQTPDQMGRVTVRFQQNAAPYPGFADRVITLSDQWRLYEVTGQADRDIATGAAVVSFQLSGAQQVLEFGQLVVVEGAASIATSQTPAPAAIGAPAVEMPASLQTAGQLINNPADRQWGAFGAVTSRPTVTTVFGRVGTEFAIAQAGANPWDAGVTIPVGNSAITEGDRLVIGIVARTVNSSAAGGAGRIGVRMQANVPPYSGFGDQALDIGPNWRLYTVRLRAGQAIAAGQAQIALHLAAQAQTVEVGPVYLLRDAPPN